MYLIAIYREMDENHTTALKRKISMRMGLGLLRGLLDNSFKIRDVSG